jgi:hypothetical protein
MKYDAWEHLTDDELTRIEFSEWLKQHYRKSGYDKKRRDRFLKFAWKRVVTDKVPPSDADIWRISIWTNTPIERVANYAKGLDPIPLDDFTY